MLPCPLPPQMCEKHQVGFRLLAVQRTGPGALIVEAEYENRSNITYQLSHGRKQYPFIVDDTGETWTDMHSEGGTNAIPSGVKVKDRLTFSRRVGGAKATSVSFFNDVHVLNPVGTAGSYGYCKFEVRNAPIADGHQ